MAVDPTAIARPAKNAIEPIRSIGRSSSAVLATIVRKLRKLPYYSCEASSKPLSKPKAYIIARIINL
jgi:hypothetical protein